MRIDPTTPYYQRAGLLNSGEGDGTDEISTIIREILRFIKQVNPQNMMTWGMEDTNDTILLAKEQKYTAPMLSMAYTRLKKQAEKQKVDFNAFYQIIADIAAHWDDLNPKNNSYLADMDWREKERTINNQYQERLAAAPQSGSSAIKAYWMKFIKQDLKKTGLSRALPWVNA